MTEEIKTKTLYKLIENTLLKNLMRKRTINGKTTKKLNPAPREKLSEKRVRATECRFTVLK